jgi:hypothetical protein
MRPRALDFCYGVYLSPNHATGTSTAARRPAKGLARKNGTIFRHPGHRASANSTNCSSPSATIYLDEARHCSDRRSEGTCFACIGIALVRIRNDSDSRALFPIKQVTILQVNVAGADTIFTYRLFPKEQVAPTRGNERSGGGTWPLRDHSSAILTVPQEWRRAMSARLKAPHYALSRPFFDPCGISV